MSEDDAAQNTAPMRMQGGFHKRKTEGVAMNVTYLTNIESALLNLKNVSARFHATLDAAAWPVAV
ncbi:hypothetical protein, partial [Ralstonia pseudosolanacearum]|uniref:hypothetical protein n=1 Tax=Ralstonia pseudosolanacearum TaxID=1310165 RepID=UPI001FF7E8CE